MQAKVRVGVLLLVCYPLMVLGCSCLPEQYSQSACADYQFSDDVFVARVINATCNCIPSVNSNTNGFQNIADISCTSASLTESGEFTNAILTQATCDAMDHVYGVLTCDTINGFFQPTGEAIST